MMTRTDIVRMKTEYPPGSHVKLINMRGEPQMPYGLKGTVLAIDEIGKIHVNWENGSTLALTEEDRFEKMHMTRVIVCRPGEKAEVTEINTDLESMQEIVGGLIEEYMPFTSDDPREDNIAIVCNEEGKMNRMPLNRAVTDEDGHMLDIIAGPFFICFAPLESETFESLPLDLEKKYLKKFEYPETFFQTEKGIMAIKSVPEQSAAEKEQTR